MGVLLVGPYPPPHGGISVHVQEIHRRLIASRVPCAVLDPGQCAGKVDFTKSLRRFSSAGWTVHVHTNGHNFKSWILALLCGTATAHSSSARILTLHSGMAPGYLAETPWHGKLARRVCLHYQRIMCVSPTIQQALVESGVPIDLTEVAPAYVQPQRSSANLDPPLSDWIASRQPLFSTTLFFRPEYGFDVLIAALVRLRPRHPSLGCVVMGGDDGQALAREQIRQAGLDEHVRIVGDIDHRACLELMSRSDVFLRPTRCDGDSISVREALSLAVPVVASRVGFRPEGTLLFDGGDSDGMVARIEAALSAARPAVPPTAGSVDRLVEIYRLSSFKGRACA